MFLQTLYPSPCSHYTKWSFSYSTKAWYKLMFVLIGRILHTKLTTASLTLFFFFLVPQALKGSVFFSQSLPECNCSLCWVGLLCGGPSSPFSTLDVWIWILSVSSSLCLYFLTSVWMSCFSCRSSLCLAHLKCWGNWSSAIVKLLQELRGNSVNKEQKNIFPRTWRPRCNSV